MGYKRLKKIDLKRKVLLVIVDFLFKRRGYEVIFFFLLVLSVVEDFYYFVIFYLVNEINLGDVGRRERFY